jgi:hypothetical protein
MGGKNKEDLMEIGCEDGRWMELGQDRVQWRTLVLAVLKFRFYYQSQLHLSYSKRILST